MYTIIVIVSDEAESLLNNLLNLALRVKSVYKNMKITEKTN